jgi:hypothetical protein
MPIRILLAAVAVLGFMSAPVGAQTGHGSADGKRPPDSTDRSGIRSGKPEPEPSQTQTGGDRRPSPADPAQADKSGANVGEGASYSRSSEKPAPPTMDQGTRDQGTRK